jgi:hypothetical protein
MNQREQMAADSLADFFYPEDGGDTFLQNVGSHKTHTAPHPRRRHSSKAKEDKIGITLCITCVNMCALYSEY